MTRRVGRGPLLALLPALVLAVAPARAVAQSPGCVARAIGIDHGSAWAPPLDRMVSLRLDELTVRDALDRVAATTGVSLSYSAELLPARRVCLEVERAPVGAVMETLLAGSTLRPVVVGASHVVLAPTRASVAAAPGPGVTRRASPLDRVIVTGTPDGGSQRGSPFAVDVIDGATLSRTNSGSLVEALELAVPGVWAWGNAAGSVAARFGSVRGASSFGVTAPKLYIDGIEVANPLLVTQLDPTRIDRIEVIRGPQGAALYGADAISGVVNILTRHQGSPTAAPSVSLSSSAGLAASDVTGASVFVQDHALSVRAGRHARTAGLGILVGTMGAYAPGAAEQRLLVDGNARVAFGASVLSGVARYSQQRAGTRMPSGNAFRPAVGADQIEGEGTNAQQVSQYTAGATLAMMPSLRWTNTVIAGVDGYRVVGASAVGAPIPPSALQQSAREGVANRGSLRLRTVGRFDLSPDAVLSLTLGAEHTAIHVERLAVRQPFGARADPLPVGHVVDVAVTESGRQPSHNGQSGSAAVRGAPMLSLSAADAGSPGVYTRWSGNSGVLAQGNLAWRDALFVVVGGRVERTAGVTPGRQQTVLPMVGVSAVRQARGVELKARAAYGRGIRPADGSPLDALAPGRTEPFGVSTLEPEAQAGTEVGFDVLSARGARLHVTRFDQRATGLIQPVALAARTTQHGRPVRVVSYRLENVGAIVNRGWEVQGSLSLAAVRLAAAFTTVDSRVARVADGYGGELREGDRMLEVPARSLSATAAWSSDRWSISTTLAHAADWIGYDRIAVADAVDSDAAPGALEGDALRAYWRRYPGVTRLRSVASLRLSPTFSIEAGGENLLDVQRGAPDNASLIAGRTLTLGVRTTF